MSRQRDRLRPRVEAAASAPSRRRRPVSGWRPNPGAITMKYLLMIYANDETFAGFAPDEVQRLIADTEALQAELKASGEWLSAYGVADQVQCKTVTTKGGSTLVTDGPYIETKEYLGSFDII